MSDNLVQIAPEDIEEESFRIIESEFEERTGIEISSIDPREFKILQRVIHATGDFSIAALIKFSPFAVDKGLDSLKRGCTIFTDVNMLASGISKVNAKKFGNAILCKVHEECVAKFAKKENMTRSEAAVQLGAQENPGIIAVGNAPTALIKTIELSRKKMIKTNLVVGVPVGFVNAAESKELLIESGLEYITVTGRRGGSPIAAAIVNALFKLV